MTDEKIEMSETQNTYHFADPFIRNKKYPRAESIFSFNYKSIDEIKDHCIFILDTPVLLYLYKAKLASIQALQEVYQELISLNRFFIPAQIAREFADSKNDYLKQLQGFTHTEMEPVQPKFESRLNTFPTLLKSFPEYEDLERIEKEIDHELTNYRFKILLSEYQQKLNSLLQSSQTWLGNDPITHIYKELFKNQVVVELNNLKERREEIKQEVEIRAKHRMPPVMDTSKSDGGLGNYLSWLIMLQIGKDLDTNVVFVTSPGNIDWMNTGNSQSGYLHNELAYEFTHETKGRSFNIISLSGLLRMFKLDNSIINDIESIEKKENGTVDTPLGIKWNLYTLENLRAVPEKPGVFLVMNNSQKIIAINSGRNLNKKIQKFIAKNGYDQENSIYFGYHIIEDIEVARVVEEQLKEKYGLP